MLDYKLVEALALVISEGSFDRAAKALHITQSAISQRVRLLEERMGSPLLIRASPLRPTHTGEAILRHYRQVRLLEDGLAHDMDSSDQAGFRTLPLAVNADSLAIWLLEALLPLLDDHHILLDIVVDDQERTHDLLVRGEVAGCLSTRTAPSRGCRCSFLGIMPYRCCASPVFAQQWFPNGITEAASQRAPAVLFNRKDEVHDDFLATLGYAPHSFPRHYLPSSEKFVELCLASHAYGMIPAPQADAHLNTGRLIDLAPGKDVNIHLHWHTWDLESILLRNVESALNHGFLAV